MAKESNANVVESKANTTENLLILYREQFETKDGRELYNYILKGKFKGRDVKVDFIAHDQGGYEVLDMVFELNNTAELVIKEDTMVDANGEVKPFTVYHAQNKDEDGIILDCRVKPARDSDKSILKYLLQKANASAKA